LQLGETGDLRLPKKVDNGTADRDFTADELSDYKKLVLFLGTRLLAIGHPRA